MKSIILTAIFLSSTWAGAASVRKDFPEFTQALDENYTLHHFLGLRSSFDASPAELSEEDQVQHLINKIRSSVVRLESGCTGTFISKTGHLLTALHCLKFAVTSDMLNPLVRQVVGKMPEGEIVKWNSDPQKVGSLYLPPSNFLKLIPSKASQVTSVQIVFMGKSFPQLEPYWRSGDSNFRAVAAQLFEETEDFAVVKFNRIPDGFSCAKVSGRDSVRDGSLVWVAGYPANASQNAGRFSYKNMNEALSEAERLKLPVERPWRELKSIFEQDANKDWLHEVSNQAKHPLYLSVGRKYDSIETARGAFPYPTSDARVLPMILDQAKHLFTTAPIRSGFSGGPVFNSSSEVIAINNFADLRPSIDSRGFAPGGSHTRTEFIRRKLSERLGDTQASSIFDCD